MRVAIDEQVRLLSASLLLGMALALLYDLLRALRLRRRTQKGLTAALDALYCAILAVSFFLFALRIGSGELRLYTLVAAALGAALFFGVFSPLLRPLWDFWARVLFELLHLLKLPAITLKNLHRNLHKIAKRVFLFSRRSLIISAYRNDALRARRSAERREGVRYGGKVEKSNKLFCGDVPPGRSASRGIPADGNARQARRGAVGARRPRRARRAPDAGEPLSRGGA
ncbi:MAG: hypothetical protein E7422_00995 [Ruminococcaceae bacterium]|nr:hypothetical protein [Oscillospiraceae bacterium]